ncbi:MAG: dihydroorotate dehydrogenase electron transfer subunit [Oscillospiraceae bacterium]|jgi:dihydroorotate dehydrogenase electron transfer subunit|nr:dihydroorotate dehydrogenase electron transfer subunit [Oscillospiraceae bacterium]
MKKMADFKVICNRQLAHDTFLMTLSGKVDFHPIPGQFVNIKINGCYLRRPISICDFNDHSINLIYKVVGQGTKILSEANPGTKFNLLCGLGNGFQPHLASGRIVLVGGGVGAAPLYNLARELKARNANFCAVLGWRSADQVFYAEEFADLCKTYIATDDGKIGERGYVTDILKNSSYDYYFACGPYQMLKGVHSLGKAGQISLEERMGCGFGACMGCSCRTAQGSKRICVDGPVFFDDEVIFK